MCQEIQIDLLCALEILQNPHDLRVVLTTSAVEPKWGFAVFRGPRGDGRRLVEWPPFTDDRDQAVLAAKKFLLMISNRGIFSLTGQARIGSVSLMVSSEHIPLDRILQPIHVNWIADSLGTGLGTVCINEMPKGK